MELSAVRFICRPSGILGQGDNPKKRVSSTEFGGEKEADIPSWDSFSSPFQFGERERKKKVWGFLFEEPRVGGSVQWIGMAPSWIGIFGSSCKSLSLFTHRRSSSVEPTCQPMGNVLQKESQALLQGLSIPVEPEDQALSFILKNTLLLLFLGPIHTSFILYIANKDRFTHVA